MTFFLASTMLDKNSSLFILLGLTFRNYPFRWILLLLISYEWRNQVWCRSHKLFTIIYIWMKQNILTEIFWREYYVGYFSSQAIENSWLAESDHPVELLFCFLFLLFNGEGSKEHLLFPANILNIQWQPADYMRYWPI